VGAAIDAAIEARRRGHCVLLETCPHYLLLTAQDPRLAAQGPAAGKVSPPLRDEANQQRLWWGLAHGYIQTVGSDHVPIRKSGQALWDERPGFAGLATALPALLTHGVLPGRITLEKVAEVTALNPARVFGFSPPKGAIAPGFDADLVVVDLEREAPVGPESTHSWYTSAFEGMTLRGWPALTLRRGAVVFRDGQALGRPGSGRILERRREAAVLES
jgi:dihydropyrimidinase